MRFVFSLLTAFCGPADGVCCDPIAVKTRVLCIGVSAAARSGASTYNIRMDDALAIYRKSGMINKKGVGIMSKDTIIKILITIIALMVFIWLWHIISRMIIGTLILTTSLLSVLISLLIQIVVPAAIIVYAVKWITKVKK